MHSVCREFTCFSFSIHDFLNKVQEKRNSQNRPTTLGMIVASHSIHKISCELRESVLGFKNGSVASSALLRIINSALTKRT